MGYISRLQAINEMLLASGEDLVSDIGESSGVDTAIAEFILDRTTEEFQFRGTAGNTYIQKVKPNVDRKIILGGDILSVRLLSHHTSDDTANGFDGYDIEAAVRGEPNGYLFNVTEQTDQWDDGTEYTVELIQYLRWEDMDTVIQKAVVSSAARWYQIITQGDDAADGFLAQRELFMQSKGRGADIARKNFSIFDGDLGRRAINRGQHSNDPSRFRFWKAKM
jgi:hypothetical protein